MDCPQCKHAHLEPHELEPGLIAAGCPQCDGVLLPLMNFRHWIDRGGSQTGDETSIEGLVVEDSTQAKLCPKCAGLMTRYQVGDTIDNKIELCSKCDEAWLDRGEWQLLSQMDIQDKLPSIFTEAWQRNIRTAREKKSVTEQFTRELGKADFARVDDFACWISDHEKRYEILNYLQVGPHSNFARK